MATTFTYAEELTLSNIRSLILRRLRVTDTSRYSADGSTADYDWFDDAINTGLKKFVRETKCLRSYAVYVPLANYQVYRCPESFIDLKDAWYYDSSSANFLPLTIKSVGELRDEYEDWKTETGTPSYIYIDRMFGRRWFFGLVPIPDTTGSTVTFDTDYGAKLSDICNLTTYNEEFIELPQSGEYYCPTSQSNPGGISTMNDDVLLEHYRLPRQMDTSTQYPEIPREYHECLADYAAWELLRHNPEDSAEFKRAGVYFKEFMAAIADYKKNRKSTLRGQSKRARPAVQGWVANMPFYKNMA